jgi:hypothetical protein
MKYITSVRCASKDIKHVIEKQNNDNTEILEVYKEEDYGNKKGEKYFIYKDIKVFNDFTYKTNRYDSVHLSEVILAIELTRFLMNEINV